MKAKAIGRSAGNIAVAILCALCFTVLATLALAVAFPLRLLRECLAGHKPPRLTRRQRRQWNAIRRDRDNRDLARLGGLFAAKAGKR